MDKEFLFLTNNLASSQLMIVMILNMSQDLSSILTFDGRENSIIRT